MTHDTTSQDETHKNENQKEKTSNEKPKPAIKEVKPWHEPVDGRALFEDLTSTFKKYLALQNHQAETLALWSIFSHCHDANNIAPKLLIHSPEKRCGKTTLLDVLSELVWKPILASNITPAVIFRVIEDVGGTIMIDEADTFIQKNSELAGIINSGHRKKHAVVWRCDGDKNIPRKFSTWAPTVIAMIGKPQDTIVDRSIIITMRRKKPDEHVSRFIQHKAEAKLEMLSRKIARWCEDNFDDLCNADPDMPDGLHDRAADNWRPLLAIADLIGGECSIVGRVAAVELNVTEEDEDHASTSTLLLTDIYDIFEAARRDKVSTKDLLEYLYEMDDRPWADWNRGRAITANQIVRHLKPFGIRPKKMRWGDTTIRGYERKQFEDAFSRYLNGTLEQSSKSKTLDENLPGTGTGDVPPENQGKSLKNNDSSVVPPKIPEWMDGDGWIKPGQDDDLSRYRDPSIFDK